MQQLFKCLLVPILIFLASPCMAQDDKESIARQFYDEAVAEYEKGNIQGALSRFLMLRHEEDFRNTPFVKQSPIVEWVKKCVAPLRYHSVPSLTFAVGTIRFTMISVQGGTFSMGATKKLSPSANKDESPVHQVSVGTYAIGETEVTQELWRAVMRKNPSKFKDSLQNPVERVSWEDCQEFIRRLSLLVGVDFRLPSETEWEYACREGGDMDFSLLTDAGQCSWQTGNSGGQTHPVKTKDPNGLGLYDMLGNVWEWCSDWYADNYYKHSKDAKDPKGPENGSEKVLRGGSYIGDKDTCRPTQRGHQAPQVSAPNIGLRLAL